MKSKAIFVFIGLIASVSLLISGYSGNKSVKAPERDRLFNTGWKFIRDSIPGAEQPGFDDSKWMTVDLPHDYSIMDLPGEDTPDQVGPFSRKSPGNGNSTGHVIGGTGWYRKSFTLDKADEGKTAMDYLGEVSIGITSYVRGGKSRVSGIPSGFKIPKGVNIFDMQAKRPSSWPSFVAGCGDIDITGEKKPQRLYRDIIWDKSKIEINVHSPIPASYAENVSMWGWPDEWPIWNWKGIEGKPLQVRVFTKASRVRLELNGKGVGEKDLLPRDKYIAVFEVPYQPGELKAIAFENGKEVASMVLKTPGEPAAIRLITDRNNIKADRNDLAFVRIEVIDANGQLVPQDSISIKLILSGNGELVASGNANPKDMASVNRPEINTFKGKALAIIRPSGSGNVKLMAESKDLKTGELIIQVAE